jgi:hypothetical protein
MLLHHRVSLDQFAALSVISAATAAQDTPIIQAVFASYKIPQSRLQRKFAPFTTPLPPQVPPQGSRADLEKAMIIQQKIADQGFPCVYFAFVNTLELQTPRACGGSTPND